MGSQCSRKPLSAAGERDGEMPSTAGEAAKLSPLYMFAHHRAPSRSPVPGFPAAARAASCPVGCAWVSADSASPSSLARPSPIRFPGAEMGAVWLL